MSYSFNVRARTKDEAKQTVEAEFDQVVQYQTEHARDKAAALAAAGAMIDLLASADDKDINVSVSGWLSWQNDGSETNPITGCSLSVVANLADMPDVEK